MSSGRNSKTASGNPSIDLLILQALGKLITASTTTGGASASESTQLEVLSALEAANVRTATEATQLSILNALSATKDIEVLLVRDKGNNNIIVKQVTNFTEANPTTIYTDVNGAIYTPVGPLEYLDSSSILNLLLAEALEQGLVLDSVDTKATNLNPQVRSAVTLVNTGAGTIPAGSLRGSVFNAGNSDGIWNGIAIPAGISIPWGEAGSRDTYPIINYDATDTNFIIEYTL